MEDNKQRTDVQGVNYMKRLAVATVLSLVALCAPALGDGYWGWGWDDERSTDLRYDANSNLWLTNNNGSHAVALGYHGSSYWTIVPAEVRPDDEYDLIDCVMSYDWDGLLVKNPYNIWEDDDQNPQPSKPCVAANSDWKFWMCTQAGDPGMAENQCVGASAYTDELGVHTGSRINFTTASTQNSDTTLASACFPSSPGQPSDWLFAAWENYDDQPDPDSYVLSSRNSYTGGIGWESDYDTIEWGTHTDYCTQPSLATGVGDGSFVYVVYKTPGGVIKFKRTYGYPFRHWDTERTLANAGDRPCVAAVGQFVFACWHSSDKIVYRFSNDAGGSWQDPTTMDWPPGTFSGTNVSAIICKNHTPEAPGIVLVTQSYFNQKYYELYMFGERFELNKITFTDYMSLSPGLDYDDLRPSVATANYDGGIYEGRAVYNPITDGKRGFQLRRGRWGYHEII
jgi:hypothetical protein